MVFNILKFHNNFLFWNIVGKVCLTDGNFFFTSLSNPNVNNMKKNSTAQSWDTGSCDKASGYATKASP